MRITILPCLLLVALAWSPTLARAELRAGAAAVDVTPIQFPVLVNGNMLPTRATRAVTPLHARAIVLDDGAERLAIVVVDSCMLPRPLADEAKQLAALRTSIRPDRMTISATHTHTAPAAMGCLGVDADPTYVPYLRERIAEAIATAESNLRPARVGWAVGNAAEYTALRRWVLRPDRIGADPFGNPTVRANMHAGGNWDNVTGESGPEDPDLSMISFQSPEGRPIALLANFSMHYFSGVEALNADYFGLFCEGLQSQLSKAVDDDAPPFVAAMSHGCSGDIWRRDYTRPAAASPDWTIDSYTQGLLDIAAAAHASITHQDADLAMAEARLELKYRVPDRQRLEWAQRIIEALGDRPPTTGEEIYAREQLILHERQTTEVVIQATRIGEIGVASLSSETYALTGLKLKLQSPLPRTMVIELANGGDGYIPPPEQHALGGYNTWAARSAGLEVSAEPKIAEAALALLERVAGKPRRAYQQSRGPAAMARLDLKPTGYWRLDELAGPRAVDSSGHERHAFYEPGVVFFLEGPQSDAFCQNAETNRSAHFAGGRIDARAPGLGDHYSVSLWFWNGMPTDGRETAGWLFSRGRNHGLGPHGDHVGIGGAGSDKQGKAAGRLIFLHGDESSTQAAGETAVERWTWNHLLFTRDGDRVRLYLNGGAEPEIDVESPARFPADFDQLFFGGRGDNVDNWEGRLDEIVLFDRTVTPAELRK